MRKLIATLTVVSLLAGLGAVAAFGATKNVTWKVPVSKTVKIHKNDKVKWIWSDSAPHNVKGKGFKSKTIAKKGYTYTHRFTTKGTFKVTCQVHPTSMKTVVKVG